MPPYEVPFLPKLQGKFAEFLHHGSLIRLGKIYQSTSVGLQYGEDVGVFPGRLPPSSSLPKEALEGDKPSSRASTLSHRGEAVALS